MPQAVPTWEQGLSARLEAQGPRSPSCRSADPLRFLPGRKNKTNPDSTWVCPPSRRVLDQRPRRKSRAEALKSGWTPGQRGRENAPLEKDFPPKTISPTVPTSSRQGRAGALNCLDPHRGGLTGTWTREHARRAPAAGIAGIPSTTPRPGRLGRPLLPEQAPRHLLAMRF